MIIGHNDYTPPFWWDHTDEGWFIADSFGSKEPDDGEGDQVEVDDILSALNELAQLRQERDSLQKRVEEFGNAFDAWWEHYSTQPSDKKQDGWGWINDAWEDLKKHVKESPDED